MTAAVDLERLREQVRRLEDGPGGTARAPLPTLRELGGVVQLRTGGSYQVDGLGLAMALLAGPSSSGEWCGVVGVPDFGAEAAAAYGVDLARTVLVPDPGDQWLEATAALVDVLPVVLLRPPSRVAPSVVERLSARLRKRSAVLLVHGEWPRCEARLSVEASAWTGVGQGHGHLRARRVEVGVRRGAAPPRHATLWLPAVGGRVARAEPERVVAPAAPIAEAV